MAINDIGIALPKACLLNCGVISKEGGNRKWILTRLDDGFEMHYEVAYVFQDLEVIPEGYAVPEDRTKPWGTGQAVLAAKEIIHEPFAVINADDYYGKEAFRQLHSWLTEEHTDTAIAMAGFILKNTLSENGGVTRGVCRSEKGHTHITDVVETGNIVRTVDPATGKLGAMAEGKELDPESYVSMNMWGFPTKEGCAPAFMKVLEDEFRTFFDKDVRLNSLKAEYLLTVLIGRLLIAQNCTAKVLKTGDTCFGVTYKEDTKTVMESFKKLIADGIYQEDLYSYL